MNKRKVRITKTGYLPNSPDRNNPMNIIPSNQITMKNVPFPIMGIDNLGNQQMMMPGMNYTFPGQYVTEIPMGKYQKGKEVKQREVVYTDPAEYMRANQAYRDSSDVYDLSQKVRVNRRNLPEIDKNTFDALNEKNRNLDPKIWAFDKVQYEEDKKKNNIKDFKDYMYEYPNFNNYQSLETYKKHVENLRKISPQYDKNNPIEKETPDKIVKLKNGIERIYPTYEGEIVDEGWYTDVYPNGTSRTYFNNELEGINAPNIKPIGSKYYGKDEPEAYNKFNLSSDSTGWYNSGEKPKFKNISNESYEDYQIPTDVSVIYKKPETKPVFKKETQPVLEELTYIEPKPLTKLPVPTPQLIPIDYSSFKTSKPRTLDAQSLDQTQRTGQYNKGTYYYNEDLKRWQYRPLDKEEVDYNKEKGKIKKQKGGLVKYQGDQEPSQVVSAGTDEMWVPLDNMTPEESKQWASLRGDALPYIGKQASNQGIYKAYDFAKSQGMDYNQYLNWLKTSSEQKEKSKPRKSLQLPIESDIIQGSDATSNMKYFDMPYEMAEYYSKLPNSPIGQDPNTGDFIYLGTPSKYERFDGKYEYYYPTYLLDYNSPEELKKDVKSQIIDRAKRDVDNEQQFPEVKQFYIERLNRLENMSPDQMTQYLFDYEFDPNDESQYKNINKPEEPYIKLVLNDTLGEYQDWTTYSDYLNPLVIPAYNTNAEAEGAKAKYDYIKESMNSPLAKFLGAEPGKVNPNVAKRAEIHGYDVAAEYALENMSSILGLNKSRGNYDTEGIRHILQNPDAFNKQLSSIINSPFGYGTISMDVTGSNRLDNVSISKAEAEKLSKYINIIQRSPKFSYMSEATPQDKFIQGTGLGWFMPASEAAKNANLLDAAGAPFELAGNVLGNYINDIFQSDAPRGNLFGNEFPTATPQPLAYSLTDPAGAAFISSLYKTGLDIGGSELELKMLSGINSIGRSIANTAKDVVSYPRPSIDMGRFRPGFITDEYAVNELNKLDDLRYGAFDKETRPFTKLFTTNEQLKKSPLNPKVKIISEIDRNGIPKIGNVEELERVITHPNSGLTPSEMMLFNEVKSGEELTNQQIAAFYKAQLNQYGATRVAPETLSWQQRLKNSIPFTKKTDTFYKSSKIKKGRTETQEDLIDAFNINNPNRAFTKEEYDIQKRLFDISGKTKQDYSRGTINWRLGDDIRNNMARGTRSYAGAAGLVGTGAMGSIMGALIDRNTDIKYDYIDPYLNPILNKLGINTASDSKAPSENLSIDLSEPGSELSSVRVNQQDLPKDFNIIIGGEFIYDNPNTVQTADFYTKNPDFKVGDKAFRAAESNAFYGIEDGKLKAGKPEEFKPETVIVPTIPANKNDFTPIKQAGLSENGEVRLIDANDQPIYQTAGSSGKLLLYSPNTGKSYFIYNSGNDLKDVVLKINNIIAKDPDVRSVTIDNGRYDHYIENKEGLTKDDFERYYESDLQNPGSPGFNLVLKYPKKQQYGGIYLGKYMFKNGGLVKYQDRGQVSFDDYMMQGLRPQTSIQESTYRSVPIIEQAKKDDVKGVTTKQKVQTAANRKKIAEEEKKKQFEAELANQGEIKPAPSEFDSNVAKAYYMASNPMSALGHYARYGYIPQGNVGNYGLRYDQSPMEMIANSVNPFAWGNAAYRFTKDLADKNTYTTLGGAGNALFDALEATPMLGAMRSGVPSILQDVNLAKSLANNKINQGIGYLESKEGVFGRSPKLTNIPESRTLGAPEMSRLADIESGMALQSSRLDPYQKLKKKIEFIESKPNLAEDDVVRMFGKSRKDLYDEFDVMESNRGRSAEMIPPGSGRVSTLNLERPARSQASRDAQAARRANRQQNTQVRELTNMLQEDPETFQQVLNDLPAYQRRNIQLDTTTEGLPRIEIPETFVNLDMAAIRNLMNAAVQKPTITRATDAVKGLFNSNPTYKGEVEKFIPSFHATDYATPRQMLTDVKSKLDQGLKGLKVGDVGTGSTNTSHNSYLNQMDFIAQNAGKQGLSKPVFLGYEQMNPMGYLSNAAIPDDEIFKYINTKLNQIQQKRGINFNLGQNAPYINEAGSIMIPQYGIRKLNDSFTKIKKRDGGLVKAQRGLELSQPIDRIPKSWKEKYDWTDNVENEYIKFKNDPNAPDNLRFTDDLNDYNVRGMWDSLDRPSNWEQALALYKDLNGEEWIPEEDGYYHAWSQHPGTGEWLKPKHHSTAWMNFAGYPMDPYSRVVVNPEGFFGTETLQTEYKQKGGSVRKVKIKTLPRKNQ